MCVTAQISYNVFMKASYWERATYTEEILSYLLSCRSMHIQASVLKGLVENREKKEKQLFAQSLYRLKKKGFIKDTGSGIF